jgi:hypothetical protein
MDQYVSNLKKVTKEDIRRVIDEHMNENYCKMIIGKKASADKQQLNGPVASIRSYLARHQSHMLLKMPMRREVKKP